MSNNDVGKELATLHSTVSRPKDSKDVIRHPPHYTDGRKFEPIDVINDWQLGFNLGNAVKYISRAGRKGVDAQGLPLRGKEIEDLEKAVYYLNDQIKRLMCGE